MPVEEIEILPAATVDQPRGQQLKPLMPVEGDHLGEREQKRGQGCQQHPEEWPAVIITRRIADRGPVLRRTVATQESWATARKGPE